MKELYIIRHGETEYNRLGIVQGRGVNVGLNEAGKKQAAQFYNSYAHVSFDKVYTSALRRTHETVELFIKNGLFWEQHTGLDELDWGDFEGREATHKLRQQFFSLTSDWASGKLHKKLPRGESPLEVKERQTKAIEYILSQENEKKVLICMHGRAMRLLLCSLTGKSLTEMDNFPHQNLSLYRLAYEDNNFQILDFNNINHLSDI